jgi:hypothetical protein
MSLLALEKDKVLAYGIYFFSYNFRTRLANLVQFVEFSPDSLSRVLSRIKPTLIKQTPSTQHA